MAVTIAFSQLKKEGLLTSKRGIGSFVVWQEILKVFWRMLD
jgi:DNA-binding GntR family transcriptional regulator